MMGALLSRALAALDGVFDAIGALWRVAARGAFAPDAKAYRGGRFAQLAQKEVFVQEIAVNAADPGEARKAVLLDAERFLPLGLDAVQFDIVGPIDADNRTRTRPERTFVLGAVRHEGLAQARANLPLGRRGGVEAFVYHPPIQPQSALHFVDAQGLRRRRLRRALVALAAIVFGVSFADSFQNAEALLDQRIANADAERVAIERRIRLAERQAAQLQTQAQALSQPQGPRLSDLAQQLNRLALHQHPSAELTSVVFEANTLRLTGRAYEPDAAELALRRAFEGESVSFSAEAGDAPQAFSAQISPRGGAAP